MVELKIVGGDITLTRNRVNAIITPINTTGLWYGHIDLAIIKIAGLQYHRPMHKLLMERGRLEDGQAYPVFRKKSHNGHFRDVVFVGDDLARPLHQIVLEGLLAADDEAYSEVAMSAMRTGNKMGHVEKDLEQTMVEIKLGFEEFNARRPDSLMRVDIVVKQSDEIIRLMRRHVL